MVQVPLVWNIAEPTQAWSLAVTSYIMGNLSFPQGFVLQGRSPLTNLKRKCQFNKMLCPSYLSDCILGKIGTERLCFIEFLP